MTTTLPDTLDELQNLRNATMSNYIAARENEQDREDDEDYMGNIQSQQLMAQLRAIDAKIATIPRAAQITEPVIDPNDVGTWPSLLSDCVTPELAYLMGRHAAVTPGCIHPDQGEKHGFVGAIERAYRRGWEEVERENA